MLDRKTPPPFVRSTSFDLIEPERHTLSNGAELFLIPGGSQEVLKIELIFHAGRWYDRNPGASNFASNLLTKGTSSKNSFQIAQYFDRFGAHVELHPTFDFVSVSLYTVSAYLTEVLTLFLEVLSDPVYPEKELEQHKHIFIQNLKVNEEKTSYLASKAFRKKLFGDDHPYGKELEEAEILQIQRNHLVDHYQRFMKSPAIFISGKIDRSVAELVAKVFKDIPGGALEKPRVASAPSPFFEEYIEKEGSVQASIRTGKKSLTKAHPDYAEVVFACHILGGYFGSRLMKNIREEKGLTYGIYASLHPLQQDSFVLIGADVNKENIQLTLDEIRKEIKALRTERISSTELETARNHFIGSLQSEITTPFAHADKIKSIYLSNLSKDFYQKMILTVDAMTPERLMEVCAQHLDETSFSSVSVG